MDDGLIRFSVFSSPSGFTACIGSIGMSSVNWMDLSVCVFTMFDGFVGK